VADTDPDRGEFLRGPQPNAMATRKVFLTVRLMNEQKPRLRFHITSGLWRCWLFPYLGWGLTPHEAWNAYQMRRGTDARRL
jgi:hypothetical protein